MNGQQGAATGITKLIRKYTHRFRIPENLEHYSPTDFIKAEKHFVRHCLKHGGQLREGSAYDR